MEQRRKISFIRWHISVLDMWVVETLYKYVIYKKSFQIVVSIYFGKTKLIDKNMAPLFYLIRNT